jgi:hypothetical protein
MKLEEGITTYVLSLRGAFVEAALPGADVIAYTRELQGLRPLMHILWVGGDRVSTNIPFFRILSIYFS